NGGWSVSEMLQYLYYDATAIEREGYLYEHGSDNFYYEDGKAVDNTMCTIEDAEHNLITSRLDWDSSYGYPCLTENLQFGSADHTYILASDGSYFYSQQSGYDYWEYRSDIEADLISGASSYSSSAVLNEPSFKFNPVIGTYEQTGLNALSFFTMYYEPTSSGGDGHVVYGEIRDKLLNSGILDILGFPVGNQSDAEKSIAETEGELQNFIGGQIYTAGSGNGTYYIFGEIAEYFNYSANCRIINNQPPICGSGGIFGFPISDPISDGNIIEQEFEEADISYDIPTDIVETVQQSEESRRYQNKEYGRKIYLELVDPGIITDVEAFAMVMDYIANRINISTDDFVKDVTQIFLGADTPFQYWLFGLDRTYIIAGFSDTGFKFKYNDSHYCTDGALSESIDNYRCISNQLLHSMLGFTQAYFHGKEDADDETLDHDDDPNPLGYNGESIEDINLGFRMADLGQALRDGTVLKEDAGQWILTHIADPDYANQRIPQDEIIEELSKYKKKFRIFEFEQNGNIYHRWKYNEDMQYKNCSSGIDLYYQDYNYFYLAGSLVKVMNPRVVWYDGQEKIIFLPDADDMNDVCSNLSTYVNNYGYDLHLGFSDDDALLSDDNFTQFLIEDYLKQGLYDTPNL
ncbi:MAG: hypothetical protein ABID64_01465, partial [Nitrospirota bacterium]